MSERTDQKAVRLLDQGAVTLDAAKARVYRVDGDHGTYQVVISAHVQLCTCPAQTRCSHIQACVMLELATGPELDRHLAAMDARRERDLKAADDLFERL